jgi:hypothetical protein
MILAYSSSDFRLVFKISDRFWRVREVSATHVTLKDYVREQEGNEYVLLPFDTTYRWVTEKHGQLVVRWHHGWDKLWRTSNVIKTVTTSAWRFLSPIEEREITLDRWAVD